MTAATTLNPFATYDPVVSLRQNAFHEKLWTAAQKISVYVLGLLVCFAIVHTLIAWPAYQLVTAVASLPTFFGLHKLEQMCSGKIQRYQNEVKIDKGVKKLASGVAKKDFHKILKNIRISSQTKDSVKINLLSLYLFYEKMVVELKEDGELEKAIEHFEAKHELANPNDSNPLEKKSNGLLYSAAKIRLKAAFCLYLIQHPEDLRTINDHVKIAKAAGASLGLNTILETSTPKLSAQIFGLKRNWSFFRFW